MSKDSTNTKCARCWGSFHCNRESISECQCAGISLSDEQQLLMASLYNDCLCRRCLIELSSAQGTLTPIQEALSPCIGVCTLDADKHHCIGCYRTLEEVRRWRDLSKAEQLEVSTACERRALCKNTSSKDQDT